MSGHTPGPWKCGWRRLNLTVCGAATECVAVMPSPSVDGHGIIDSREREANARRICLAVNACAGLSDSALESGVIERMAAVLKECADDLEAELNERIPEADRVYPSMNARYERDMEPVRKARAALALLEAKP